MERFWSKVEKDGAAGCWRWCAALKDNGYGAFRLDGRTALAHRVAYELVIGPIPVGLDLDHLCRNRWCVNPAHLEPVTRRENLVRGDGPRLARLRLKTHCKRGHPYDDENTGRAGGRRVCKECRRRVAREQYHKKKAA